MTMLSGSGTMGATEDGPGWLPGESLKQNMIGSSELPLSDPYQRGSQRRRQFRGADFLLPKGDAMASLTLMVPTPTTANVVLYAEVHLDSATEGDGWRPPFYIDISGLLSDDAIEAIHAGLGKMIGDRLASLQEQEREQAARMEETRKRERLERLAKIAGGDPVCAACGANDTNRLEIDHIIPKARNGGNNLDNLQVLCRSCNSSKGTKTMAEWVGAQS